MAGDQISATTAGEPGFTFGSFALRLLAALAVVLLTFNPSGFSFFHWARDAFLGSSLGPLHALAGLALLIGWVLFVQATRQSLGLMGVLLVGGLFAVLVWMLFFYDVVTSGDGATLTWIVLIGVAVMVVGVFYSRSFGYSRLVFIYAGVIIAAMLILARTAEYSIRDLRRRRGIGLTRILVVGTGQLGRAIVQNIVAMPELGFQLNPETLFPRRRPVSLLLSGRPSASRHGLTSQRTSGRSASSRASGARNG